MDTSSPRQVKAFISYSHEDRVHGGQAKTALAEVCIVSFLAHEDLNVSDEWRERILEELRQCDLFVPLLSANFLASKWHLRIRPVTPVAHVRPECPLRRQFQRVVHVLELRPFICPD